MSTTQSIDFSTIKQVKVNGKDTNGNALTDAAIRQIYYKNNINDTAKLLWAQSTEQLYLEWTDIGYGSASLEVTYFEGMTWAEVALLDNRLGYTTTEHGNAMVIWSEHTEYIDDDGEIVDDGSATDSYWIVNPNKQLIDENGRIIKENRYVYADEEVDPTVDYVLYWRTHAMGGIPAGTVFDMLSSPADYTCETDGEGKAYYFTVVNTGKYKFYTQNENAVIGYEHIEPVTAPDGTVYNNGVTEWLEDNYIELDLTEGGQIIFYIATQNWQNDTLQFFIQKLS